MKKICFILPPYLPFPPVKGGAVETLLNHFVEVNEKMARYDVTVFSVYDAEAEKKASQYQHTQVVYVDRKNISLRKLKVCNLIQKAFQVRLNILDDYNRAILTYINTHSAAELYIAEGGNYIEYANISKRVGRDKMVLHIHAVSTPHFNANNIFKSFIFVSQCSQEYWEKRNLCEGYVLLNAVDESRFHSEMSGEDRLKMRRKLGVQLDDFLILFCGRLVEGKGVLELVKAIRETKQPKIKLVVVGSSNFAGAEITPYQKELLSFLDDQVVFTGYVENSALPDYYRVADLVVSPSTFVEGAPLVNLEAMMCGKPVLTTSQGGIPEYANPDGVTMIDYYDDREQLTKDLAEAISKLYSEPDRLKKMGKSNSEYAQKFGKQAYFENYSHIIETIIGGDKS